MLKRFTSFLGLSLVAVMLFASATPVLGLEDNMVRVWVQYAQGRQASVQGALRSAGAQVHYQFADLDSFVVTLPRNALKALSNNPNVVDIEEDVRRYPVSSGVGDLSSAKVFDLTLGAAAPDGQTVPWGIDAVQARDVWDADRDGAVDAGAPTGARRMVCIIDSGLYDNHEDFAGVNIAGGYSQVDVNPNDWTNDGIGHGTHVAGTVVGANNSLGVVGVTPGAVSLYIVKVFNDDGSWTLASDLVDAANRCADAGANVISMSLSGDRANGKERRALNNLYNAGVLSVAAASNDGGTAKKYPASYDAVISVAAIDESDVVADFSQQNDQVELSAPGVSVLSTVPYIANHELSVDGVTYNANHIEFAAYGAPSGALVDGGRCTSSGSWNAAVVLCERGDVSFYDKVNNVQNGGGVAAIVFNNVPGNFLGTLGDGNSSIIPAISLSQEDGQFLVTNKLGFNAGLVSTLVKPASGYESWDGTSMATPHVSAVAALIWSANTSWTNAQIRNALQNTALDLGTAGRDIAYGFGLVQAYDAWQYLGGGGLNNPPSVAISSPADGSTFASGYNITFSGSASDAEDGDLTANLVWTSDIDGQIGNGGSFSVSLSDGTHTVTASVSDSGGKSGSDSVTITVGDSGGALNVIVTTDKVTYTNREKVIITVHVTDGATPVQGAAVDTTITTPKGRTLGASGMTNANGDALFSYKVNSKRDGVGTYTVDATASKSGYTSGSGSTTFEVQ